MSRETRIAMAVGCVVLSALSIPVLSRPTPDVAEPEALAAIPQQIAALPVASPPETPVVAAPAPPAVTPAALAPAPAVPRAAPASRPAPPQAALTDVPLPPVRAVRAAPESVQRTIVADVPIAIPAQQAAHGWSRLVAEARKYIGTNPTDMQRRWCARFMNLVLARLGYNGTGSDAARSFASYGERISQPKVGAIAVLSRGRNQNLGHVGVISGFDSRGNPIIISGNHGRRVAESVYPRARVIAYVLPTSDGPRRPVLGRLAPPPAFSLARAEAPLPRATVARGVAARNRLAARRAPTQQFAARRAPARGPVVEMRRVNERPAFLARLEADLGRAGGRVR